ncbi:hypothetical protein ACFXPX_36645 [Kitasatospora sp. NPDC059146]|uniref:hypothetical protein n=1 Tax=unclassified Kitasatospora TaxID=2633591 RepID=UPI00369657C4
MLFTLPGGTTTELLLPPATELLTQDPAGIAVPERLITDGWLTPATGQLLHLLDHTAPHTPALAAGSHTTPGHTLLLLADAAKGQPALYLRLPDGTPTPPRPADHTSVLLPLTGTLDLALFRHPGDVDQRRPQYLRTLNPGQLAVLHAGATVELTGPADGVQLVLTHHRLTAPDARPLDEADYEVAVKGARARLARRLDGLPHWPFTRPEDIPGLLGADLPKIHAQQDVLHYLAVNRTSLSYLVTTAVYDYQRYDASRTTPLLDRVVLCLRPEHGFELHLNTNHRPDHHLPPRHHAHPHGARVLTGGYLHTVHTRTDGWNTGPFTADQLRPAVTTTELPGSSYTLGTALAHRTLMRPDTTTLTLRGPRTSTAHAADGLLPPDTERPMTDREHHALYGDLAAAGVIDSQPPSR